LNLLIKVELFSETGIVEELPPKREQSKKASVRLQKQMQ
jgi:hypothetical protein